MPLPCLISGNRLCYHRCNFPLAWLAIQQEALIPLQGDCGHQNMDCCILMSIHSSTVALVICRVSLRRQFCMCSGGRLRTPAAHTQDPGMLVTPITGAYATVLIPAQAPAQREGAVSRCMWPMPCRKHPGSVDRGVRQCAASSHCFLLCPWCLAGKRKASVTFLELMALTSEKSLTEVWVRAGPSSSTGQNSEFMSHHSDRCGLCRGAKQRQDGGAARGVAQQANR